MYAMDCLHCTVMILSTACNNCIQVSRKLYRAHNVTSTAAAAVAVAADGVVVLVVCLTVSCKSASAASLSLLHLRHLVHRVPGVLLWCRPNVLVSACVKGRSSRVLLGRSRKRPSIDYRQLRVCSYAGTKIMMHEYDSPVELLEKFLTY